MDILIVNDNSAVDSADGRPDGQALFNVQQYASFGTNPKLLGMPLVPGRGEFLAKGLKKRPSLFGSDTPDTLLILYLPNQEYTYVSNTSTFMLQYASDETKGMISNGNWIATYGYNKDWPLCIWCAMMQRSGGTKLPECTKCYDDLCYKPLPVAPDVCPRGSGTCTTFILCGFTDENCLCGSSIEGGIVCFQHNDCDLTRACMSTNQCALGWQCIQGGELLRICNVYVIVVVHDWDIIVEGIESFESATSPGYQDLRLKFRVNIDGYYARNTIINNTI